MPLLTRKSDTPSSDEYMHYSKRNNFRRPKPSDIRIEPSEITYVRRFYAVGHKASKIALCPTAAVGNNLSLTAASARRK
uniref:Uncharacterized protein n=1 Tax=Zea mays TaxID=4577 RepID=C4J0E0_MAIZE|nr:unknown [Zea mays]